MTSNIESRVRQGFSKQGFMSTLGATIKRVERGICYLAVPYADSLTQQHGFFHGGVVATLADNAAGCAAYTLMDADRQPLTVEFKISFLAPAQANWLEARAHVLRAGHRLHTVQVEVLAVDDTAENEEVADNLVAVALATITATRAVKERNV